MVLEKGDGNTMGLYCLRCKVFIILGNDKSCVQLDGELVTPTLTLPHQGGGDFSSLPPCGGGLGWGGKPAHLNIVSRNKQCRKPLR